MAKFKKKIVLNQSIPTSSMPDVVFMLLFFFMVTTQLRKNTIEVKQNLPTGTQLRKLERKTLVANLYIGEPVRTKAFGKEAKIQADDAFLEIRDIIRWVSEVKFKLKEEADQLTVAIKADQNTKRGIITDVETELRKGNARKVLYTIIEKDSKSQ